MSITTMTSILNSLCDIKVELQNENTDQTENLILIGKVAENLCNQILKNFQIDDPETGSLTIEEKNLVKAGMFINAIKSIRFRLGNGLKEAKDMADAYRNETMYQTYDHRGQIEWKLK